MNELAIGQWSLPAPLPPIVVHILSEAEQELHLVEERIVELQDELAVLQEQHCTDCPRTQEMVLQESKIAKRRLLIMGQECLRQELIDEITCA